MKRKVKTKKKTKPAASGRKRPIAVCPDAATYTAELPPKCQCTACIAVWQAAQAERIRKVMLNPISRRDKWK